MPLSVKQTTVTISASTSSASGTIPANAASHYIRVTNPTTALCYVNTGAGSATAVATNQVVGPNTSEIFEKPTEHDTVAVLLSASTGSIVVGPCGAAQ